MSSPASFSKERRTGVSILGDDSIRLRCKECAAVYLPGALFACDQCFAPLEIAYDYDKVAAKISRRQIAAGPLTLWRYEHLLPAPAGPRVDMGAGFSRLRPAPRLAAELGLRKLWIKEDAANPTHSFKDRVVSVALSVARAMGYDTAACASTGNLANSVAAHASAAGMRSVVFIPARLEEGKVAATAIYGGEVVQIDGSYDDVNRICSELAEEVQWAFVNVNLRPYYSEGSKTIAFEIAEQLGFRAPAAVVVPMASGSLLTKTAKGFAELARVGLVEDAASPALYGAQAAGCDPIARAFQRGDSEIVPVKPDTVAKSLAIGDPADGYYALRDVRSSGGAMASVPEPDVETGIRLLAQTEGLFTETAGGVAVAGLEHLVRSGAISHDQETVIVITGTGLKTLEVLSPRLVRPVLPPRSADVLEQLARR